MCRRLVYESKASSLSMTGYDARSKMENAQILKFAAPVHMPQRSLRDRDQTRIYHVVCSKIAGLKAGEAEYLMQAEMLQAG